LRALGVLAAIAVWLASTPAAAQEPTHTLWEAPKFGRWTVKAIRSGLRGPAQCVMSNIGDGSGVAYAIQPGDVQRLVIQNREWRIAPGTASAVQLQVDRYTLWEVMARRSLTAADTVFVDARFDAAARRLLEQMREGDWLHIAFPSGERYRVSLEGSKFAGGLLLECYQRFGGVER
jgi:hypothetical protein